MSENALIKQDVRQKLRQRRRDLSPQAARLGAERAAANLHHILTSSISCVGLYIPMDAEIDTTPLFHQLAAQGKQVGVPKVVSAGEMRFYQPSTASTIDDRESMGLMVVPGIAFTRAGDRLGFGGGFYDRFLKEYRGIIVGFAYEFQVIETLPRDDWDISMQYVVTDESIYECRS